MRPPLPHDPLDAVYDAHLRDDADSPIRTLRRDLETTRDARLRQLVVGADQERYLGLAGEVRGLEHAIKLIDNLIPHAS